ncbi:hypothetical protein BDN70DRAFT_803620 [Pholiota conissans]|uniref:TECPR1-like DysF domain-containing protein n=1 Tax=Pholiota conissans TaxID=109636 RepID=A0A9P5Z4T6_9AGAR|nr:hypothetical protein BDN70DRAFT_803620 [Pholiota conissans]
MSALPPAVPPPAPLTLNDDPDIAVRACQRLSKRSRFSRLFSFPNSASSSTLLDAPQDVPIGTPSPASSGQRTPLTAQDFAPHDFIPINLDSSALADEDLYTDRYEWAILYENQRGITVFSTPYYSSLSLLPSDPSPFTLPDASLKRSDQPPISLENYPLPDGNWHWVSRCWMIDMRTDTGEVQHDGFEYNWFFRRHKWRAQIGSFNAGGWVRRRRWVRLMVRPAKPKSKGIEGPSASSVASLHGSLVKSNHRTSMISTPPSVNTQGTDPDVNWNEIDPDAVWLGDPEEDWERCRVLMKKIVRDGRKLELWRLWLGFYHPEYKEKFLTIEDKGKRRERQWTEDEYPLPSELTAANILSREFVSIAPREHVTGVLRIHGQQMLHLFVFPDSRAQLLKMLGQAGMLPELNTGLGLGFGATEIDFWSYASGLDEVSFSTEPLISSSTQIASESKGDKSSSNKC